MLPHHSKRNYRVRDQQAAPAEQDQSLPTELLGAGGCPHSAAIRTSQRDPPRNNHDTTHLYLMESEELEVIIGQREKNLSKRGALLPGKFFCF